MTLAGIPTAALLTCRVAPAPLDASRAAVDDRNDPPSLVDDSDASSTLERGHASRRTS